MGRGRAISKRTGHGGGNTSGSTGRQTSAFALQDQQDIENALAHHWSTLPNGMEQFLAGNNNNNDVVTFQKLLAFWRAQPLTLYGGAITSTMCGSSFYLSLNYLRLGMFGAARNLLLNGGFLQEAYHTPMSELIKIATANNLPPPRFLAALDGASSVLHLEAYLKMAMPSDYQRMMNFASQNANGPCSEYVKLISQDWEGGNSSSSSRRGQSPQDAQEETMCIILLDEEIKEPYEVDIERSSTLKALFNDYAETRGISLRSLRFSHNGKTLFLSSVKNKTPQQLGLNDHDTIAVTDLTVQATRDQSSGLAAKDSSHSDNQKISSSSRRKSGKKGKKKGGPVPAVIEKNEEELRIEHSKILTKLHEEADPRFKRIRQCLNNLVIERSSPKVKSQRPKFVPPLNQTVIIDNPSTTGLGGKAGKSHYIVQIGEVQNLYKTSKPRQKNNGTTSSRAQQQAISIDLHGLTKIQALQLLDEKLPLWNDTAMSGLYPFVIPVEVVCGCGNQVLSEVVEGWIRRNDKVSNAPKNYLWVPTRNSPHPYAA